MAGREEGGGHHEIFPRQQMGIKFKKKMPVYFQGIYVKTPLSQKNLPALLPPPPGDRYRSLTEFEVQVMSCEPSFIPYPLV